MDWFGSIGHIRDLAASMTEQYNSYAGMSEDMPTLDEEWVAEKLEQTFDSSDLELLLEDEFGKGLVMGQLRLLFAIEEESKLEDNEEEGTDAKT